jgi:Mor family transcriptional regulator
MGTPAPEETERNLAIYNDHKSGMSGVELVKKYGITSQRIHAIVRRERKRHE